MQMIREMCKWLKANGLFEAPLHFSRFFPRYKMQDIPPTPRQTLYSAKQIAQEEGIKLVYLGYI
jgi:pyruvate formate lyase activating enzyme